MFFKATQIFQNLKKCPSWRYRTMEGTIVCTVNTQKSYPRVFAPPQIIAQGGI